MITENNPSSFYYDTCYQDYANYYSRDHLHYGFWYDSTKDFNESLINTIKEVINHLNIQAGDRVLDAGCGIGGSCRYIVEKFKVETYGITFSKELHEEANKELEKFKYKKLLKILLKDYTDTGFGNDFFNKIYALESFCHALDKQKFTQEAYRILKPNGALVVADFFKTEKKLNKRDEHVFQEWLNGWYLPDILTINEYTDFLKNNGFHNIQYHDMTNLIKKSSKIIYDNAQILLIDHITTNNQNNLTTPNVKNIMSCCLQKECIEKNIWKYVLFSATK